MALTDASSRALYLQRMWRGSRRETYSILAAADPFFPAHAFSMTCQCQTTRLLLWRHSILDASSTTCNGAHIHQHCTALQLLRVTLCMIIIRYPRSVAVESCQVVQRVAPPLISFVYLLSRFINVSDYIPTPNSLSTYAAAQVHEYTLKLAVILQCE